MGPMNNSSTIIVGGGIAGLATALALGQREVMILEQAKPFSNIGAGLQLGPNAVRALQKLGAWDAVEPITSSPPEIHLRDGVTGKLLKRLALGKAFECRYGTPYRVAHRADLHQALLSVVKSKANIEIKLGETVSGVENYLSGVHIESKNKSIISPAAIITDGVNSQIRQALFPASAAIDSGSVFHRALFQAPNLASIDFNCVTVWLYPQGHVVHYQVGASESLNLIAITPKSFATAEHFFKAASPLQSLLECAKPHFSAWPGLYIHPLPNWCKGNILILGDAAHATLPYLAQGAAMALEDAAALADVLLTTHSIKHAFNETAQHRMERTKRLHNASLSAGKTYHMDGVQRLARDAILRVLPNAFFQRRLDWIYNG